MGRFQGEYPAFRACISTLGETEREVIIKARGGQDPFRDGLIARWGGCSVTGCGLTEVLIASHIKPWSKRETPAERLGAANGLLWTPNLDRLFDRGLVSFDDNFRITYSPLLKDGFAYMLNVGRTCDSRAASRPTCALSSSAPVHFRHVVHGRILTLSHHEA